MTCCMIQVGCRKETSDTMSLLNASANELLQKMGWQCSRGESSNALPWTLQRIRSASSSPLSQCFRKPDYVGGKTASSTYWYAVESGQRQQSCPLASGAALQVTDTWIPQQCAENFLKVFFYFGKKKKKEKKTTIRSKQFFWLALERATKWSSPVQ